MNLPTQSNTLSSKRPRVICVDDNIRNVGGHFFELATLLLNGAQQHGLQPVLATHSSFDGQAAVDPTWPLARVFNTRRMVRWSLGIDGSSKVQRDLSGRPIGGMKAQNAWVQLTDRMGRPSKRPATMLSQWANDLSSLLMLCKPTKFDSLLINTGDDFVMLALAAAMCRLNLSFSIRIDVIFHFAVYEADQKDGPQRMTQFGNQINDCLETLAPHDVHLHATTDALADQMRETPLRHKVNSIPYPTRSRTVADDSVTSTPPKIVLAGLPRAEKGRESITRLLQQIDLPHLRSGNFRMSMQMPADNWQSMVPKSLHANYQRAAAGDNDGPLEIMTSNLSTDAYHRWLDTSDIGLFLYEPERYVARCSGVLLEMMVRGVPVIVPDDCWLADQVRAAGGDRSIGFIYQDRDKIPELLHQFLLDRDAMRSRAIAHAAIIAARHQSTNTIHELGIAKSPPLLRVAS